MNILSRRQETLQLEQYLSSDLVLFLDEDERDAVIDRMISHADACGVVTDKAAFRKAIFDREKIISTGIGVGVAIPHAKLTGQDRFFVSLGLLSQPVDWDSIDKAPVRLVCLIGGPDDAQTHYLQILSQITEAIKDESRRRQILLADRPSEVVELFTQKGAD